MPPNRNLDAVNFNIPNDVLEKWTATRKSKRNLGDKLYHPRIFSTVQFKTDRNWFIFAMIIEFATILVAIFFTGFNVVYIAVTIVVVVIDVLCAIFLHKPQEEINRLNCNLELNNYEGLMKIIDNGLCNGRRNGFEEEIKSLKLKKLIFIIVIIIIALIKSAGVIIAVGGESLMINYVIPVLFGVTAYVHIKHSGYYLSEIAFLKARTKEEKIFFRKQAMGERNIPNLIISESIHVMEHVPEALQKTLTDFVARWSEEAKIKRRYNSQRNLDPSSSKIMLFMNENNDNIRVLYDQNSNEFLLSSWGEILDNNLFALIDGGSIINDDLKSFIGYCGLRLQTQRFAIGH